MRFHHCFIFGAFFLNVIFAHKDFVEEEDPDSYLLNRNQGGGEIKLDKSGIADNYDKQVDEHELTMSFGGAKNTKRRGSVFVHRNKNT